MSELKKSIKVIKLLEKEIIRLKYDVAAFVDDIAKAHIFSHPDMLALLKVIEEWDSFKALKKHGEV